MGYTFKPKNKSVGDFDIGAFSWPLMLDRGLGLVLGTGKGFSAAEFIYINRPDNCCVQYNDGARVSAAECKDLARVARWIARIESARITQFGMLPAAKQAEMRENRFGVYDLPWHPDTVKRFTDFADWCEKSGGFRIY